MELEGADSHDEGWDSLDAVDPEFLRLEVDRHCYLVHVPRNHYNCPEGDSTVHDGGGARIWARLAKLRVGAATVGRIIAAWVLQSLEEMESKYQDLELHRQFHEDLRGIVPF